MADAADETFEGINSGASKTFPKQCSALRKNDFVMLKTHPCKIVEMSTSKTGKHGHAKVHLVGMDIFTNKKYEDICPSTHNMNVPVVERKEYELIDINKEDRFLSLMDDKTVDVREDLKLGMSDIEKEIEAQFSKGARLMVTVLAACDMEHVISFKPAKE